jgi:hypothetical protein
MNDYSTSRSLDLNYKVVYVPLNKDLIYPVYIPIVVNDEDIFLSSGKLSERDYTETIKLNQACGFPILPLISVLAPTVIPGLIKLGKKYFKKSNGGTLIEYDVHRADLNDNYEENNEFNNKSGYIPTNPNIKTLKDLQKLYDDY